MVGDVAVGEATSLTKVSDSSDLDEKLTRLFASDPKAMADPYPLWNRMREEAPVHFFDNAYLLSSTRAVKKLLADPRATHGAFRTGKRAAAARAALPPDGQRAFDEVSAFEGMYMSRNDGEIHDRLRRIAQRTFTPKRIAQIREVIEDETDRLLTDLSSQDSPDFMTFAYQLPLKIIGDLLAIPEKDLEQVHIWTSKLGRNRGGTEYGPLMEAHEALGEFRELVEGIIEPLKSRPRGDEEIDLVGDLMDANQDESLNDEELVAMFVVLLFAGHETTTNLLSIGLKALLESGEWEKLRDNHELMPNAIEELLRFVTPVQWLGRNIEESMEIDGLQLEDGDGVILLVAGANRDPEVFEDPNTLNIERANSKFHLGFGRGSHICLGSPLARMETSIAFEKLLDRFPDISLATETFDWQGHALLRSMVSLPVKLGPERKPQK